MTLIIMRFSPRSPPLVSILNQFNPAHATPSYLRLILISTHLRHDLSSGLFSSGFLTNVLHAFLFYSIRATCLVRLVLLDSIILVMLGEEYKL
jgi:hypothetical protein